MGIQSQHVKKIKIKSNKMGTQGKYGGDMAPCGKGPPMHTSDHETLENGLRAGNRVLLFPTPTVCVDALSRYSRKTFLQG